MNVRDALIQQSPSLALQRVAMDLIAQQDAELDKLHTLLYTIAHAKNMGEVLELINNYHETFIS